MVDSADMSVQSVNRVYVYFLFEHKSHSDPLTVLQLLSYIVRVRVNCARNGRPPCPVLPLVIHHGQSPWTAARRTEDLVPVSPKLAPYQVRFGFPHLDLGQLPADARSRCSCFTKCAATAKLRKNGAASRRVGGNLAFAVRRDLADRIGRVPASFWSLYHGSQSTIERRLRSRSRLKRLPDSD